MDVDTKTVTSIPAAAKLYNSPIYGCESGFVIGTDAASKSAAPSGWAKNYDIVSDTERAKTEYGLDYEDYLEKVLYEKYYAK